MSADSETETIRWPTNLDRKAIEERLNKVANKAAELKIPQIADRFANVAAMTAGQLATNVVSCLTWVLNQPQHDRAAYEEITKELEMVALNLKNLK